jgi:hypothetical protein
MKKGLFGLLMGVVIGAVVLNSCTSISDVFVTEFGLDTPSVIIKSPADGTFTNYSHIIVKGSASVESSHAITKVEVKLNDGAWVKADGTTSWSRSIYLDEGDNIIRVRATADNGKVSVSTGLYIFFQKSGELIFVSTIGNDNNPGTRTAPVKSIQKAVEISGGYDTIYVSEGIYTPGKGLNTGNASYSNSGVLINTGNLTILGGWNYDFTKRNGVSELDGETSLKHIIWIADVDNITIDGFIIRGGNANGTSPHDYGSGIYIFQGNSHLIKNTVISNNFADIRGGGIHIDYGTNHVISGIITNNHSGLIGGGVFVFRGASHIFSGTISGNISDNSGGGIYLLEGINHTISGIIIENTAAFFGGGVFFSDFSVYNDTHSFLSPTIEGNSEYGLYRDSGLSDPQGIDTINWGDGNSPANMNW